MASLANRMNRNINAVPGGALQKPTAQSIKIPTLAGLAPPAPAPYVEKEKAVRINRVRVAQENVLKTAGKENGPIQVRARPENVQDIYSADVCSESLVVAYVEHIYGYLHEREKPRLSQAYMNEMSINPRMRTILMDWLVSVTYKFHMCQDSLYLGVDITDRFLATPGLDVTKDELQLIGVTALFIASKFEEVYPPELEDFIFISDNACTKEDILETEMAMAHTLNFDFTRPNPLQFLRRCCKAAEANSDEYSTAKYIAELSLLSIAFVEVLPSLIAAAALYLTLKMTRPACKVDSTVWTEVLSFYSGHEEKSVIPVAEQLLEAIRAAPKSKQQCIYKKYCGTKHGSVAKFATEMADRLVLR